MFGFKDKIIPESLIAYQSRIPDSLNVQIRNSADGGYWVEITNVPGCLTQAENGEKLFAMVNDAVFTYFEVPKEYVPYMPIFLPTEETRKQFGIRIPDEFLKNQLVLRKNQIVLCSNLRGKSSL